MRRTLVVLAAVAVVAGLGGLLAVGLANQDAIDEPSPATLAGAPPASTVAGEPAPPIAGEALDGSGEVSLAAFRGRPVVVNFWASWCGPCREEAPELVRFAREHPEVQMLSVNAQDARPDAIAFAGEAAWDWPNVFDPEGALQRAYGLGGLPGTYVIDRDGNLRATKLGATTADELAGLVAGL